METAEALAWLREHGKPGTALMYSKHGVTAPKLGVSYGDMNALAKRVKRDHGLALGLWQSGLHEARVIATKVADPRAMDDALADAWLLAVDDYPLSDALGALLAQWPGALAWARRWIGDAREWPSATAWVTVAQLAGRGVPTAEGRALVDTIRETLPRAPNRTRYTMNGALIALGGADAALFERAVAAARAIGPVEVDHGETGCKTPDAEGYLAKMKARAAAKPADRKSRRTS